MDDMFSGQPSMEPGERSAREISEGDASARATLVQLLAASRSTMKWKDIWPQVLDRCVITHAALGDIANGMRKQGQISVPDWTGDALKRPKDDFEIKLES